MDNIITSYDVDKDTFKSGGKSLKLTFWHVFFLRSLPQEGEKHVKIEKDKYSRYSGTFPEKYFEGDTYIKTTIIFTGLNTCLQKEHNKLIIDFARLMALYAFATFFFVSRLYSLHFTILASMENLEGISKIKWWESIHSHLIINLKKQKLKPRTVCGCAMLLLVNICPLFLNYKCLHCFNNLHVCSNVSVLMQ